mgnify:FL=1
MPIRNVLLYVCDALRWDALPSSVAERGVTVKTVAQSTWSPPCFTTLSTGRYPQRHGVLEFSHELAEGVETVYDIPGLDGAYYNKHPNDRLADVFGVPQDRPIADLTEPFLFLERDLTTHTPYDERAATGTEGYLSDVGSDWDRIRAEYERGVGKSVAIFEDRLDELRERGVLDETLVVFTADHGELLGEYGDIGHSNPTCPELAYVPTVFVHPSLSAEDFAVDPASEIIEQVDVVETALSVVGFDDIRTDGVDVLSRSRPDPRGYNYVRVAERDVALYESESAWDYGGGQVFLPNSTAARLAYFGYRQLRSATRHTIRDDWPTVLRQYLRDSYRFGDPDFSAASARQFIDDTVESFGDVSVSERRLDDETKQHLKEMGYRT